MLQFKKNIFRAVEFVLTQARELELAQIAVSRGDSISHGFF
jgi:hypothetical protein